MRGHIVKRGKSWCIVVDREPGPDGKRRRQWITCATESEAERELARILHERHTGTYTEPAKATLAEYLAEWLQTAEEKGRLAPKTLQTYRGFISAHVGPALGHLKLSALTPLHLERYYGRLLASGRKDGKGGLAPVSVLHQHRMLHAALGQAVRWRLLARNPADGVDPPRVKKSEAAATDEEGLARLLQAAAGTWLRLPILLAGMASMRRGEVLALRWSDVSLDSGTAKIKQAQDTALGGERFKAPKTHQSNRPIHLTPVIVAALREIQEQQRTARAALGPAYQDHDLIVCREDGHPYHPDSLTHAFDRLTDTAGVDIRFHDLRHSFASLLIKHGEDLKTISGLMGHASIAMTANTYGHLLPGAGRASTGRLDDAMRQRLEG